MVVTLNLPWLDRIRYPVFLGLSSVVAFLAVIYFFCPRFVLWQGVSLDVPPAYSNPEVNRAMATLKKIERPFQFVEYPPTQNADINWRLLFPLVGHFLHLPWVVFCALPHIGCLLVLALVTHLVCQQSGNRPLALAAATLLASTSWFFVSTGWLTYFDSWYVLGLLVAAFVPARWALAVAILLTPWVDERFVLSLPVALMVRAIYFKWFNAAAWQTYRRDLVVFVACLGPYVALRLYMMLGGSDAYPVTHHLKTYNFLLNFHAGQMIESIWTGLRAVWVFVILALWLAFPPAKRAWSVAFGIAVVGTEVVIMALAGDFSRNMSTLLPVALLGVLLALHCRPAWSRPAVYCALAFNLLAPAAHGFNTWRLPINNLYTEIENYKNPPQGVNPAYYNELAVALWQKGDVASASVYLNCAVRLNPNFAVAYVNRALLRRQQGDRAGAIEDLNHALSVGPRDWADRSQIEKVLAELRKQP